MIYLDNAATYISNNKDVYDVFINSSIKYPANSNSSHRLGYLTNKTLDEARKEIIKVLKLNNEYEVVFTSGATEGVNFAIKGYALKNINRGKEIICFKNEHPSVLESINYLKEHGFIIHYISPNSLGEIDYEEIKKTINKNTILVCAMSVNNEVGSINDIDKISSIINEYPKCVFFSDVTQSIGKVDINYNALDMFTFSAHKFGGIIGSGVLVKKKKILLEKMMLGGSQENNYRSGTVAVPLHLSTIYALKKAIDNLSINYKHVINLQENLINELKKINEVVINFNNGFPYIVNFSLINKKASVVIEALSNKDIYVSSLSACSAKTNMISYNLLNMGVDKKLAENSIRVSFSSINTIEDINIFIKEIKSILEEIK